MILQFTTISTAVAKLKKYEGLPVNNRVVKHDGIILYL